MAKFRFLAALLLTGTLLVAAPASAAPAEQAGDGNRQGNIACFQSAAGGQTTGGQQTNRSDSKAILIGLIAAAIQNASVNVEDVATNLLSATNVQLVCLNDVLNQNDIDILNNLLQNSDILSHNQDVLSDNLRNFLNNNNVAANVEVISVDIASPTVFLLGQ